MSYESQFQSIEAVEREIADLKGRLTKLTRRRDRLRAHLISSKGPYSPSPTKFKGGVVLLPERSDGFWLGREHR